MKDRKSYLVRRQVTAQDTLGEVRNYFPGAVISDWELSDYIKSQIASGVSYYTQNFEPLTDKEAKSHRVKATAMEGKRSAPNGQVIDPPFDDYIGLHPKDVIERIKTLKFDDVEKVRQYERAGMNRSEIVDYVAPSEREPFYGYADMGVREIQEKMDIFDDDTVKDIIIYEMNHQRRPAIIEFERETPEVKDDDEVKNKTVPELETVGAHNKE